MPRKLIPASEYRPLPPKLQALDGGFAEMRGRIHARQMRRIIPRTESNELDQESLHRAVGGGRGGTAGQSRRLIVTITTIHKKPGRQPPPGFSL